jgi:hypothetical protein
MQEQMGLKIKSHLDRRAGEVPEGAAARRLTDKGRNSGAPPGPGRAPALVSGSEARQPGPGPGLSFGKARNPGPGSGLCFREARLRPGFAASLCSLAVCASTRIRGALSYTH